MSAPAEDEKENGSNYNVDGDGGEQQQGGEEAAGDSGSSAVQDEDAPSLKLREAWPQVELDGDKGLVVCTVDVQLLTGGLGLLCNLIFVVCSGVDRRYIRYTYMLGSSVVCIDGLDDCCLQHPSSVRC